MPALMEPCLSKDRGGPGPAFLPDKSLPTLQPATPRDGADLTQKYKGTGLHGNVNPEAPSLFVDATSITLFFV